jgi:hypothetical protein
VVDDSERRWNEGSRAISCHHAQVELARDEYRALAGSRQTACGDRLLDGVRPSDRGPYPDAGHCDKVQPHGAGDSSLATAPWRAQRRGHRRSRILAFGDRRAHSDWRHARRPERLIGSSSPHLTTEDTGNKARPPDDWRDGRRSAVAKRFDRKRSWSLQWRQRGQGRGNWRARCIWCNITAPAPQADKNN